MAKEETVDPIDRHKLVSIRNHWAHELTAAKDLPCDCTEHEAWWGDVILASQAVLKDIEDDRTTVTKPINQELRRVNGEFKDYAAPAEAIKLLAKDKIKAFMKAQAQAATTALLAAEAAAAQGDGEACAEALAAIPEASKPRGAQKTWKWTVLSADVTKLAPEYLLPNGEALLALCDNKSDIAPVVAGVVFERVPVVAAGRK